MTKSQQYAEQPQSNQQQQLQQSQKPSRQLQLPPPTTPSPRSSVFMFEEKPLMSLGATQGKMQAFQEGLCMMSNCSL